MPEAESARNLPRDAAVTRERLLSAASELFGQRGLDVTLNDIAHHAGVGVSAAYHRFANEAEVIDALFEQRLEEVARVAQQALDDPDPLDGLVDFLERALHLRHGARGLDALMNTRLLGDGRVNEARDRIAPLTTELVEKAKQHNVVRPDLDYSDLVFMQLALSAIIEATGDVAPELYQRYLIIFLDGIRTDGATFTPLPASPLSVHDTHRAMTRHRPTVDRGRRGGDAADG